MVGQLLEIRLELKANWMQKFPWKRTKNNKKTNPKAHPNKHQTTTPLPGNLDQNSLVTLRVYSTPRSPPFFFPECCMAQRRSLSGRSPFCQRKQSKCRNFTGSLFFHESNKPKTKHETKHQPRSSLPESAGAVGCGLFLGRLDQGLVGNAESTHVNRPKGKATFVP